MSRITRQQRLLRRKSVVPDSSHLCRLCLSKERRLTRFLSDESGLLNKDLLRQIYDLTTVEVDHLDIFPTAICSLCDQQLHDLSRFREKCIENDTILHNLFGVEKERHIYDLLSSNTVEDVEQRYSGYYGRPAAPETGAGEGVQEQQVPNHLADETEPSSTTSSSMILPEPNQTESTVAIALNQLSTLSSVRVARKVRESSCERTSAPPAVAALAATAAAAAAAAAAPAMEEPLVTSTPATIESVEESSEVTRKKKRSKTLDVESAATDNRLPAMQHTDADDPARSFTAEKLMSLSNRQLEDGRFQCGACARTFRNAYTLKRHLKLHTEENLYECEYCGKRFNDRSNWKIHLRAHTGDNLYNCLVCLKSYISPSTLKYHLRAHRKLRSFDCRVCQAPFPEYEELERHVRDVHRGLTMEDLQMEEEPLLDAANFVKIELEDDADGAIVDDGKGVLQQKDDIQRAGSSNEDDNGRITIASDTEDEHGTLNGSMIDERHLEPIISHTMDEGEEENRSTMPSRTNWQAQSQQPLDSRNTNDDVREPPTADSNQLPPTQQPVPTCGDIKQEVQDNVTVKEELHDPRELLTLEDGSEAETDESKDRPNEGTVILFRCDYCMQIFHYLDDLNVHMELHNKSNGTGGGVVLGSAATVPLVVPPQATHHGGGGGGNHGDTGADGRPPPLVKPLAALRHIATTEGESWNTNSIPASEDSAPALLGAMRDSIHTMYQHSSLLSATREAGDLSHGTPSSRKPKGSKRKRMMLQPQASAGEPVAEGTPEHPCTKCAKRFRTEELLRVHEETHANDAIVNRVRSCRICLKVFKCELNLQAHMRKHTDYHETMDHHTRSLLGDLASRAGAGVDSAGSGNESTGSYNPLSSIMNNQPDRAEEVCGDHLMPSNRPPAMDGTGSSESLGDSEGEIGSGLSSESSGSSSSRSNAIAGSRRGSLRRCEICAITFDDPVLLERHVLSHFERNEAVAFVPSADRPFKCTECHKRFKRKDYLLIHIRTHTGERRYKCDLCSSAFVHPSNLITHRKLHSNERPHKCDLCDATFKLYAGLKIHRRRCVMKNLTEGFSFSSNAISSATNDGNDGGPMDVENPSPPVHIQSSNRLTI
ncbi:zinc finger protein Xfin-like [Anopheles aquasalis]|uniref:zinc finger protein Xfin-like n=1 Tax=Anopheles aquasalis TaxID=42839 RepID=UPI00215A1B3E|nr:zinc finger protein Xfin-like [Anopheles aquasalis]XP_050095787.1 zinc finger protein Xfin-like [Anopheles aquasalis]XP_050095788.1 zinc finger protein Xfin-like [Anopheles aquasalis]